MILYKKKIDGIKNNILSYLFSKEQGFAKLGKTNF